MARALIPAYRIIPRLLITDIYPPETETPDGWHLIDDDTDLQDDLFEAIFNAIAAQLPDQLLTLQTSPYTSPEGPVWHTYFPEGDQIPAPRGILVAAKEAPGYVKDSAWVNDPAETARRINLDGLIRDAIRQASEQR